MKKLKRSRLLPTIGLALSVFTWLANSSNPPTGRTGAPFDGNCNNCHGGGSFTGTVDVEGMPATVEPNTTYPLTITLTPASGNPVRGGFQLVAVDANNANCGNLTAGNAQSGTEFSGSREYLEHRGPKNFTGGGPASWTFSWTSPASVPGNTVKFYFIGLFANGSGSSGDNAFAFNTSYAFSGGPPLAAGISDITDVACFGENNGALTVTATGGSTPYTYLWSNGQTGSTATNLTAGTYTVTVTGAQGSGTATASASVTQPTQLNATASADGTLSCNNPEVAMLAQVSGGTPGYTYNWSNGETGNPAIATSPGTYTVTITDANNCTKTASATVTGNTTPPNASASGGLINCAVSNVTLNGGSTTSNVTFSWTGPNGFTSSLEDPVVSVPGNYTLTVTNTLNGCTSTAVATVQQDVAAPAAGIAQPANLNCLTTQLQLDGSPSSQGPAFSYQWSTSNGNIVSGANTLTPVVNQAGTYMLLVTNNGNGCTSTASVAVQQTPAVSLNLQSNIPVSCFGQSNGSASVAGGGGLPPIGYQWNTGDSTASVSGLVAGTYMVTASDAEGCSAVLTVTISQPELLLTNASATGETVLDGNDGTATAAPTGGTAPFSYLWSNGETTASIDSLAPGAYTVTVTDNNGCTAAQTVTVNAFNCSLTALLSSTNISCHGASDGSATLTPAGGTQPLAVVWSNGATALSIDNLPAGTYTATLTDASGCSFVASTQIVEPPVLNANAVATSETAQGSNDGSATAAPTGGTAPYGYLWSNGETTANIESLAPGAYTVTVTDNNGCTAVQTVTVNAFNCALSASATFQPISCYNGSDGQATVSAVGGTNPFSYLWSNGATTASISNLSAGTYSVTVNDASGCFAQASFELLNPVELTATVVDVQNDMNGSQNGSINVTISGGAGAYTYAWTKDGLPFADSEDLTGLGAGTYQLTATDGRGCTVVLGPVVVDNTVSSLEPGLETVRLRLWPNPAADVVQVSWNRAEEPAFAQVVDMRGNQVLALSAAQLTQPVPVHQLPAGLYSLQVVFGDGRVGVVQWMRLD